MNNVIQTNKSVFNIEVDAMVNTINCVGFMGKGIAFEYGLRYPEMLAIYQEKCQKNEITPGSLFIFKENEKYIINFATKNDYKFPSRIEWIEKGLIQLVSEYKKYGIKSIAMPPLGCGLGGLSTNIVIPLIEKYLGNLSDLKVYVCFDKNPAEGIEKDMIDRFNNTNIDNLKKTIRLTEDQLDTLIGAQNHINRFRDLMKLPHIGITTYTSLHNYYYNYSDNQDSQLSLF